MKSIKIIILCVIALAGTSVSAQQDPNYTLYRYNMNLINPAFAGAGESTEIGINIRSQWASVEGAPETQSVLFSTPMGKNVGMGVSIINDKTFIETQTSLSLDFSYKLKLNDTHDLFMGLKAGFNSYDANTSGLLTYGIQQDPSLMDINGRFNPNLGIGLYLNHKDYYLSFSLPKLLTPDRLEEDDGLARLGVDRIHMYFAGGYNFELNNGLFLKPAALIRYTEASPISVDFTALLEFNKHFNLGAGYRLDESLSGILIFKTSNWLELGYAYEVAIENSVHNIDNATHEIMLNLKL